MYERLHGEILNCHMESWTGLEMSIKDLRACGEQALNRLTERSAQDAAAKKAGPADPATPPLLMRALTAPGARALLQPEFDRLQEEARQAKEQRDQVLATLAANPVELELDRIIEVPGHRRRLSPEEFADLRANLEVQELVHPVVVRLVPTEQGAAEAEAAPRYELISGYNRLDVFRVLGRRTIPVRVLGVDDAEVDGAAFWSNLLQPSLPDYEKYLGLKQYKERHDLSDAELARKAGVSKTLISFLMAFGKLPAEALEALESSPRALGANFAHRLAKATQNGRGPAVVEAINQLIAGEIKEQDEAVRRVEQGLSLQVNAGSDTPPASGRKVLASTVQFGNGPMTVCRMVSKGTSLRFEFKLEEHRERAQEILARAMDELASQLIGTDQSTGS